MPWLRNGDAWESDELPYRIERIVECVVAGPADSILQRFTVRRDGEELAIRCSLGRAIAYCEERWRFLDGRH